MRRITTVIIGAGHSGLAMSQRLSARSIDHVLLERGQVANSWRTERWDSLRLLTPNWHSRLPGHAGSGADPNGFRSLSETIEFFDAYARFVNAPVETDTSVLSVHPHAKGYRIVTNQGEWYCRTLVIASGAMNLAHVPAVGHGLPPGISSLTPHTYRRPEDVDEGGVLVVGASSSGVQIAGELKSAGREVTLAVGEHVRVPRTYRGRDIIWLMDAAGVFDDAIDDVDDINRVRSLPSMQLIGSASGRTIDLNSLQSMGIRVAGRLVNRRDGELQFSGSLDNVCRLADLKMQRLLRRLDEWIDRSELADAMKPAHDVEPTCLPAVPPLGIRLGAQGIRTVVWATGFRPDYSWLTLPVLDCRRQLRHHGGVVDMPGVYALGLPFMRRRKSNLIDGAADDTRDIAAHLADFLDAVSSRAA